MGTQTEKDVTASVRSVLNIAGVMHWKQWQGPMSQPRGVSDIIGIRCFPIQQVIDIGIEQVGVFFACELKRPGGSMTPDQETFIRKVRMNGGIGFMADDPDTVIDKLLIRRYFLPFNKG